MWEMILEIFDKISNPIILSFITIINTFFLLHFRLKNKFQVYIHTRKIKDYKLLKL